MGTKAKLNKDGSIQLTEWYSQGGVMIRRDALPISHPEHPINVIRSLGADPCEYGYAKEEIRRQFLEQLLEEV